MEIFLWCLLGYFVFGLVYAYHWSKIEWFEFYWPMIFWWPIYFAALGLVWVLHKFGFRIG